MKFIKNAMISAKSMPKGVWIAAVIIPGGFTVIGIWLTAKTAYDSLKKKRKS